MLSGKPSVSRLDRARPLVACKSKGRKKVNAGVEPIFNSITFMSCYSLTRIMLLLGIIQASLILLSLNRIIRNVQRSLPLRIVFSIRTSKWL